MEKHEFMPRMTPLGEGARDLPPPDMPPLPRGENIPAPDGGCGCEPSPPTGGGCVGYEGCGEHSHGLSGHPLAMVYAPCQLYHALYDPATALSRGTLFCELDLPLGGAQGAFTTEGGACCVERRRT